MSKFVGSSRIARLGMAVLLVAIAVASATMRQRDKAQAQQAASASAKALASAGTAARSKDQGMAALMALPELSAWSAYLEKTSGGKVHGGLIEYDATERVVNGASYWQFSFVESSAEASHRWESFLVATKSDAILVEDLENDKLLTLAEWRNEKKPMKRITPKG